MDITVFMTWFVGCVVTIARWCWDMLDKITFMGTSLLDFSITLVIIGVVLNLMFSLVKAEGSREMARRSNSAARARSKSNEGDE